MEATHTFATITMSQPGIHFLPGSASPHNNSTSNSPSYSGGTLLRLLRVSFCSVHRITRIGVGRV